MFGSKATFGAMVIVGVASALAACAVVVSPLTIAERVIEDRSFSDIATDNRIVLDANAAMADAGIISVSTEIYEQRLLMTGIIEDPAYYNAFLAAIKAISGVKELYWHVTQMSEAEQEAEGDALLSWADTLTLEAMVAANVVPATGVNEVNYRVTTDSFSTVYLISVGRSAKPNSTTPWRRPEAPVGSKSWSITSSSDRKSRQRSISLLPLGRDFAVRVRHGWKSKPARH